jgi:hypothetical protein
MIQKSDRQNEQFGHFSNFMEFYFQIKILKSLFDFDPKFRGSFDIKKKMHVNGKDNDRKKGGK